MAVDLRIELGKRGEELAAEHLTRLGFRIVDRNYRTRWGELDLVAFDGQTLAFCEVKTRCSSGARVYPLDAVRPLKRIQVRKMAGQWLVGRRERPYADELRFDAIGVIVDRSGRLLSLEHLEGAF